MPIWHSVISVSGIKLRYNPVTQELRLTCVKLAFIKLTELQDFYVIQVCLSLSNPNYPPQLNPPNPPLFAKVSGRKIAPLKAPPVISYLKRWEQP